MCNEAMAGGNPLGLWAKELTFPSCHGDLANENYLAK